MVSIIARPGNAHTHQAARKYCRPVLSMEPHSGVGGLTVAREIIRQIPEERIVYFGDTARLPYGSKSRDTIIRYSRQIIRFLQTMNVKAIVIACNTASAYALETVRAEADIPVIGVINAGARTAVHATGNKRIGVIGTEGTIGSGIYTEVMKKMKPDIEVFGKSCPLFVPLVEEGLLHDSVTDEIASRYLSMLKGKYIDTLVLGCTHYPLLSRAIEQVMGAKVTLINSGREAAHALAAALEETGGLCAPGTKRRAEFYVTDAPENFSTVAELFLGHSVEGTRVDMTFD